MQNKKGIPMPKTQVISLSQLIRIVPVESRFDRIIRETKFQLTYNQMVKQTLERR